jgi:multidrug efflux pump subunit AcrB
MNNLVRALLTNAPLANICFVLVLILGLLAYQQMPREQDPEINFNWVNITTIYPGASAEDVERLITNPLEDALKSVADVRFVASNSRENASNILVRFRDLSARQFDKRVNDLRREIQNRANEELPSEAREPLILEITTSNGFPTATLLLTGNADDDALRLAGAAIKDDLERIEGVDQVYANGLRDPELLIEFDAARLAAKGLLATDASDAVRAFFRDVAGGTLSAGNEQWLVRLVGTSEQPEFLARIPVSNQRGSSTTLDSVATIARARANESQLASYNGKPTISYAVSKRAGANTLDLVEKINAYIAQRNPGLAATGHQLILSDDATVATQEAIKVMETNAITGLLMVLLICWLFLGFRVSLLVSLGIPFSLAGTFIVLNALGFTINISVLLGIVIVLGMLVDDAVVICEAIYYRLQRGASIIDAAFEGVKEVWAPVLAAVLTTLAAFLPLMLLPGIVGKFMFVIPFVVTLALLVSLIEAYWMMPNHMVTMRLKPDQSSRQQRWRKGFNFKVRLYYTRGLTWAMRRAQWMMGLLVLLFILSVAAAVSGLVKIQFFAFDPIRLFYINIDMPSNTSLEQTLTEGQTVEAAVKQWLKQGEIRAVTTVAGIKFTETEPLYGDNYGQIVVSLNPRRSGMRSTPEVVEAMRQAVEAAPKVGRVSFTLLSGGPPSSKAISAKLRGNQYTELRAAADALKAITARIPGARDVVDDEVPGRPELSLQIDREGLARAGLNATQLTRLVRLHVDGEVVAQLRDGGQKLEVRIKAAKKTRSDIGQWLSEPIALPNGAGTTTLGAVLKAETRTSPGIIKHYGFRRSITVEAGLDKEQTDTLKANQILRTEWQKISSQYPGVDLDFSGELDDIKDSLDAMPFLFLMGLGLIYLILAAQFRSYFQPLLVMATVPMAFIGVTAGLLITGNPLSLYTLYGVIALTGISVNSAIVLIDAANERKARGMKVLHAIVYASRRRVIPILITSSTTIGGLFSLATGLAGESMLWGPVASSLVWGLTVSTLLTLFVIPALYRVFVR